MPTVLSPDLEYISVLMLRKDMSGRELARRAGLHRNTVWAVLNGRISPSLSTLSKMADALDVRAIYMLEEHEDYGADEPESQ